MIKYIFISLLAGASLLACNQAGDAWTDADARDTLVMPASQDSPPPPAKEPLVFASGTINTGAATPGDVLDFAKTLIGTPYHYASTDPSEGFDCSGFITYVFNHFNISVPRSSVDFTNMGKEILPDRALPGDLILFTGTDSTVRVVGHMGLITENSNGSLQFIHSTSGRQKGVVITPFENYYKSRFVKVIRIFPEAVMSFN